MISRHVTLVLGAGASYPYGFPLGEELKNKIVDQILFPHQDERINLDRLLRELGFPRDELTAFALRLKVSYYLSVDAFLEEFRDYTTLGKHAIAANIIDREMKDSLMTRGNGNKRRMWYHYLMNLLGNREDFLASNLSIITYNYDRSLEYFIYYSLMASFDMTDDEVINCVKSIPIIHVHGHLGLPHFLDLNGRDYASTLGFRVLQNFSDGIKIIHEDFEITPDLKRAHEIIQATEILVFIGCGYHRKNIERLMLREYFKGESIVCTFYGKQRGEIERDSEIIKTYSTSGRGAIPIHEYTGDALGFLQDRNYLK